MAKVRAAEAAAGGGEALTRAVAINLFKLMAYKDEYEVARLYSDGRFDATLAETFKGGKAKVWLAPPIIAPKDAAGRPKKIAFGGWMLRYGFPALAKLKGLRGGPLDLFGATEERKLERRLIADYEAGLDRLLAGLTPQRLALAVKIAQVPDQIRGYGHIKEARSRRPSRPRRRSGRSGTASSFPLPPCGEGPEMGVSRSRRHGWRVLTSRAATPESRTRPARSDPSPQGEGNRALPHAWERGYSATMTTFDFDACVVGAGAVGLACGYALARRGLSVVVLEKERAIGQGVSSRNSEVVHGGLYYPTGSLKARLCVAGRRALYRFLDAHHVAYRKCGKIVVATHDDEVGRLEEILAQANANGVEGMREISGAEARRLEPGLSAVTALISPESGVFDSHGYMLALSGEIEDRGGAVVTATPFEGAAPLAGGGFTVRAGGESPTTMTARLLVTAPGLSAQAVAGAIDGFPTDRIPARHYGKGVYFRLTGKAPFEHLVYPPPIHGALGTHYRKDLGGQAVFGPDLAYVETEDYSVDPARVGGLLRVHPQVLAGPARRRADPGLRRHPSEDPWARRPAAGLPLDGADVHGLPGSSALFGIESPGPHLLAGHRRRGRSPAGRLASRAEKTLRCGRFFRGRRSGPLG